MTTHRLTMGDAGTYRPATTGHTTTPAPAIHLSHPSDPYAVVGAIEVWASVDAAETHTDDERLAAIEEIMARHQAARAES